MSDIFTLTDLKEDIRDQIRAQKELIRELKKTESAGIDRRSGHYSQTGKYEMLQGCIAQVEILEIFLEKIMQVTALRRRRKSST